jgi:tRNA 2-thiouridine synthesizing protein C
MKKLTFVFRSGPHSGASGREGLDLVLLSASFEQEVSLVFTDEGVLNLLPGQRPELIGAKDYIAAFKALPLYDIENVYVCEQSLQEFGLSQTKLLIPVEFANAAQISRVLDSADEVLVF